MRTIKLEATECDVLFYLKQHKFDTQLSVSIEITSRVEQNPHTIRSIETSVGKDNLTYLIQYIEDHAMLIESDPHSSTPAFADSDLLYSVQGLSGRYNTDKRISYAGFQIFVNIGSPPNSRGRVYFGASLSVDTNNIKQFVRNMRQAIAHISSQ